MCYVEPAFMTDRNPSPRPTDTVSQLTHYIDVLHGQIRAYAGKGKRKWAAAASEALYSAVEELRAASAEVARAREEADVQRERLVRLVPDVLVHVRPKREALGQTAIIGVE